MSLTTSRSWAPPASVVLLASTVSPSMTRLIVHPVLTRPRAGSVCTSRCAAEHAEVTSTRPTTAGLTSDRYACTLHDTAHILEAASDNPAFRPSPTGFRGIPH